MFMAESRTRRPNPARLPEEKRGGASDVAETLIECKRRPMGKPCTGLMWVDKAEDDGILAHCLVCRTGEAFIHNWQKTEWAGGMMEAVPVMFDAEEPLRH